MRRVGIIGTGHVGGPMAVYCAKQGRSVTVSERSQGHSQKLAAAYENISIADNQGVIDASEIVILALRPHIWKEVVAPLDFREGQQVISVMAGVSMAEMAEVCAPVTDFSATIPLSFIQDGGCPLPVYPSAEPLQSLFGADNPVLPVASEHALNQHFAASTLLSAVLGVMETGADWLGDVTGDRVSAEIYVASLLAGYLADISKDGQGRLAEAKWGLATEGTLNLQMVDGLKQGGVETVLHETLAGLGKRMEN